MQSFQARRNILHVEDPGEQSPQGRKGQTTGKNEPGIMTVMEVPEKRGLHGRKVASASLAVRDGTDIMTVMDKLWGQGT